MECNVCPSSGDSDLVSSSCMVPAGRELSRKETLLVEGGESGTPTKSACEDCTAAKGLKIETDVGVSYGFSSDF